MDIRTLLTETKSFPSKRKADSLWWSIRSESSIAEPFSPTSIGTNSLNEYVAPTTNMPKNVKFTLNDSTRSLNLTVSPNDPPSAITATVKDFFALHNSGVSFTDSKGCILIITPDNLTDNMEVIVNQTGLIVGENSTIKKRRKSTLSSRKKSKKLVVEKKIVEEEEDDIGIKEHHEKSERIFSSDVSIDNILYSSRRRPTKFSSQVHSPKHQNLMVRISR